MVDGRSLKLFLVEGSPTGILTAEIMNWTGHVLVAPRSKLGDALKRSECTRTGVYLLLGDDPEHPTKPRLYVGEADSVADRIRSHAKDVAKDFWTRAFIITSKNANLTKAHGRYLESRMVELAKAAGRANVANGNDPAPKQLPESDVADMEYFIAQLQVVLPVLGVDVLSPKPKTDNVGSQQPAGAVGDLHLALVSQRNGVDAKGVDVGGGVVVLAGSRGTAKTFVSNTYGSLRDGLIKDGSIEQRPDGSIVFVQDVVFPSPSAAAAVLLNRNSNGRTEWRVSSTGQTLKDWQDQQLAPIVGSASILPDD